MSDFTTNAELRIEAERLVEENDKLRSENARLRELLFGAFEDMDAWQKTIACSDQWGYGKGCLERLCELRNAMQKLGIEVGIDGIDK